MQRRRFIGAGVIGGLGLLAGCLGFGPSSGGTGETGPGEIAVPSGFDETSAPPVPEEGVTVNRYTGSGTAADALEAFTAAAEDAGWEGKGQVSVLGDQWSGAGFERDDEVLVFHATESNGEVTVTVVRAPKEMAGSDESAATTEETAETEDAPPESDSEGEDHPDAPRYPDSVRTDYRRVESETEVHTENTYLAGASVEEVGEYYEETLPDYGWKIVKTGVIDEEHGIIATKEQAEVQVVWQSSDEYGGYTEITVYVVETK